MAEYRDQYRKYQFINSQNDHFTFLKKQIPFTQIFHKPIESKKSVELQEKSKYHPRKKDNHSQIIAMKEQLKTLEGDIENTSKVWESIKKQQQLPIESGYGDNSIMNDFNLKLLTMTQRLKTIAQKSYFSPNKKHNNSKFSKPQLQQKSNELHSKSSIQHKQTKRSKVYSQYYNVSQSPLYHAYSQQLKASPNSYKKSSSKPSTKRNQKTDRSINNKNKNNQHFLQLPLKKPSKTIVSQLDGEFQIHQRSKLDQFLQNKIPIVVKHSQSSNKNLTNIFGNKQAKKQNLVLLQQFSVHRAKITAMVPFMFQYDSQLKRQILTSSLDYTVKKFCEDSQSAEELYRHRGGVQSLILTDQNRVYSGGRDCYLRSFEYYFKFDSIVKQVLQPVNLQKQQTLFVRTMDKLHLFDIQKRKIASTNKLANVNHYLLKNSNHIFLVNREKINIIDIRSPGNKQELFVVGQSDKLLCHPHTLQFLVLDQQEIFLRDFRKANNRDLTIRLQPNEKLKDWCWMKDNMMAFLTSEGYVKIWTPNYSAFKQNLTTIDKNNFNTKMCTKGTKFYFADVGQMTIKQFNPHESA